VELEEIHGFISPGEYRSFVDFVEGHVKAGNLKEVPADPKYGRGEIYGGRWFKDTRTGETWRLVPPDYPFKGLWEPVK
jgi:hypothetical protein